MNRSISREAFSKMLNSEIQKSRKIKVTTNDRAEKIALESLSKSLQSEIISLEAFDQNSIQTDIRNSFGKQTQHQSKIGTHPDFKYLEDTEGQEYHYICSLFLDIKNSTRLSFLFDLEDVTAIKNTILKAAADAIIAMDGHVHRFMGDALLAFFGGKRKAKDDSIADAINCASVLESLMVGTIIPVLNDEYSHNNEASHLGFRIGLDYGSNENVLWSSYGFRGVSEVTPTSFYVDVASKLQSIAGKNKAMLGQSIIDEIDLPDAYTKIRVRTQVNSNGGRDLIELDKLPRTYTKRDGSVFRYKIRELDHDKYRDLLPFSTELKAEYSNSSIVACPGVKFQCFINKNDNLTLYPSLSRVLDKGLQLNFKATFEKEVHATQAFPLELTFTKKNYGTEAQIKNGKGVFTMSRNIIIKNPGFLTQFFRADTYWHKDSTAYRGLHTMEATVKDSNGKTIFKDIIGIFIK